MAGSFLARCVLTVAFLLVLHAGYSTIHCECCMGVLVRVAQCVNLANSRLCRMLDGVAVRDLPQWIGRPLRTPVLANVVLTLFCCVHCRADRELVTASGVPYDGSLPLDVRASPRVRRL